MLLAAATILLGFIVLIWSADLFVAGAASIAENLGMSPILIGLTIVSLGTSAPEVLVSLTASLSGSGELAVGNAVSVRIVAGAEATNATGGVQVGGTGDEVPPNRQLDCGNTRPAIG